MKSILWRIIHARTDQRILELHRLILGSVSLLWFLANLPNWQRDYGPEGIMQAYYAHLPAGFGWQIMTHLPGDVWGLAAIGLILHFLFLGGVSARTMSLLLWGWHHTLLSIDGLASNSEQFMMRWMFLYGAFLPWGKMWKIGRSKISSSTVVTSWARRMMQIHVVFIYLFSTLWKIGSDPYWIKGQAVYFVLQDPLWSRVAGQSWILWPWVVPSATYASLFLEGAVPLLIWHTRIRPYLVFGLVVFHLGLAMLMQHIGFFSLTMITALVAWLEWKDLRGLGSLLDSIRKRQKTDTP